MGRLLCSREPTIVWHDFLQKSWMFLYRLSTITENGCNEFCNNELLEINLIVIHECSKNKNTLGDILYYILLKDYEFLFYFFFFSARVDEHYIKCLEWLKDISFENLNIVYIY